MNYKRLLYFFAGFLIAWASSPAKGQSWEALKDVSYVKETTSEGYEIESPRFGSKLRALEGKRIILRGYMVPLEEMRGHRYFVLSALPYNICFFCGGAGPETVAEVYLRKESDFTDKAIRISGILELNQDDPFHLMYLLKDSEIVNEE